MLCDLLWADPAGDDDAHLIPEFTHNNDRDCSVYFGKKAAKKLLDKHSLTSILRGHQVQ